jgi:2-methylcitrate dehydratase PrpD
MSETTNSGPRKTDVTRQHAETIAATSLADHPGNIQQLARRAVLDGVANALLARDTPLGATYLSAAPAVPDGSPVIGGSRCSPTDAAFVNAGLWNALDWDDTVEGAGHPGSSVVPAALAVGIETGATIKEFLNAVILGYELAVRAALAYQPTWDRYELVHGSGTRHALGAAAAAAAVANYSVDETAELLSCGAQLAPVPHASKFGWDEQQLTWLKDNNARAASAGVRAWQLVDNGFAGPGLVLDGETGFWRMAGSDRCDWETLANPLTGEYQLPSLAFKPYPCCRWLHTTVESTRHAASEVGDVKSVFVETTDRVADSFMIEPSNQVNAEFSLPFVVGQAIYGRDPTEWYGSHGPTDTPDFDLRVKQSDEHTCRFESERVAGATVTVRDESTEVTKTVDRPLGGSRRPLDHSTQEEKLEAAFSVRDLPVDVQELQVLLRSDEPIVSFANSITNTTKNE